ncbi:MAG TPA: DinB family protein [Ferruginibacter sp.]|nr:DinB family protein [Ferruginibacter sp.]
MPKPIDGTFPPYFSTYTNKVKEDNVEAAFKNQQELINTFFDSIPAEKADFAYAPGKWTLKEMLQHIIDAERIFAYRALCIARKESQSLPGFEENEYAQNSLANTRHWISLVEELKVVRRSTTILFESFTEETLSQSGISNNNPVTVNALGFVIIGHVYHHVGVIKERYLG